MSADDAVLLVLESANPRSLACAVELIGRELAQLSAGTGQQIAWTEGRRFAGPRARLLAQLSDGTGEDPFGALLEMARQLAESGKRLSDEIGLRYFSHAETLRSQIL